MVTAENGFLLAIRRFVTRNKRLLIIRYDCMILDEPGVVVINVVVGSTDVVGSTVGVVVGCVVVCSVVVAIVVVVSSVVLVATIHYS